MSARLSYQLNPKLGFMQGRLSKPIDGKIQAFPWKAWREEFHIGAELGFRKVEWTIDYDNYLYDNPIMNEEGRNEIIKLVQHTNCSVSSITADCIMLAPFWKAQTIEQFNERNKIADEVIKAAIKAGVEILIVPAVDQGKFTEKSEEKIFIDFIEKRAQSFVDHRLKIAVESDYEPKKLKKFIDNFGSQYFGINYDMGNSASLGYESSEEIDLYGDRIINVHIKDRKLNGTTIPLGLGDTDMKYVFNALKPEYYLGNWIFQTARSRNGEDVDIMKTYIEYISDLADWIIVNE